MYAIRSYYVRRLIQQNTDLPVVMYSFTERTKASELLTRMEALVTIVDKKALLARKNRITSYNVCYTKLLRLSF